MYLCRDIFVLYEFSRYFNNHMNSSLNFVEKRARAKSEHEIIAHYVKHTDLNVRGEKNTKEVKVFLGKLIMPVGKLN